MVKNLLKILVFIFCVDISLAQSLEQCVQDQSYQVNQTGPYQVGDVIEFTYNLADFEQVNINWIHAFQINVGSGWINLTPISAPGNPGGSNRSWIWVADNYEFADLSFGPGWRFQNNGNGNWGTSSTGPFTMTFQATVGPTCTVDELNMSVQAIGDCLTGGWDNGNCCEDPIFEVFDGSVSIIENENDTVYLSSCESIEWNGQNS